jgi:hypothetical protein
MFSAARLFQLATWSSHVAHMMRTRKGEDVMTQTNAAQATEMAPDNTAIRPFQVSFSDAELADLRNRITAIGHR